MKIGIDGNEANVDKKVGVSVYTLELLNYFQKEASLNLDFTIYLKNRPLAHLPKETKTFHYEIVSGPFLWSQVFLPLRLFLKKHIDVFFSPAHYSPRFLNVPLVVTIHDLAFFYYPQEFLKNDLYKLKNWTANSIKKAKKIIAVSKNTKKDILKYYEVPSEKIEIVYNGFEKQAGKNKGEIHVEKPYFLFTGTLQPRKNLILLIKAFAKFKTENHEYKLVLVGKKGWLYSEIFEEVKKLNLNDSVVFTDYIDDTELTALYKNAEAFIMPSLYEGFGVPVLEAMSFDTPVLSSFASSLPEVGGDACLYFDPTDEKDLLEKMRMITENKEIRKELIAKGKERIKFFSWRKCAEETLKVITEAV